MDSKPKLTDFKVLCFDCYGTLIDWDGGMIQGLQALRERYPSLPPAVELREAIDEIEPQVQKENPSMLYYDVLAECHRRLAQRYGVTSTATEDQAFGDSIKNWIAFSDTAESLQFLQSKYKIVILSNADRKSFSFTIPKLGVQPDAILIAEDIGSYKPSLNNFHYMLDYVKRTWNIQPHEVLVTAQSLFHDHNPANQLGLSNAWINRTHLSRGNVRIIWEFDNLAEFVEEYKRS